VRASKAPRRAAGRGGAPRGGEREGRRNPGGRRESNGAPSTSPPPPRASCQAVYAGAPLEHVGRRFDDLHTEVALMERRLKSGTGDARKIKSAAAALAETLWEARVVGDVDPVSARLTAIVEHADEAAQADRARRDEYRAAQ